MANRLNWQIGRRGKGYVTQSGDVVTWTTDIYGEPDHTEVWQSTSPDDPEVFLFYIEPDGGINDGGIDYRNMSGRSDEHVIDDIIAADPRCYDDSDSAKDFANVAPREEYEGGGYGHAWQLMGSSELEVAEPHGSVLDELAEWLNGFNTAQPVSLHHDHEQDLQGLDHVTPNPLPALVPPSVGGGNSQDQGNSVKSSAFLHVAGETNEPTPQEAEKDGDDDKAKVQDPPDPEIVHPGEWGEDSEPTTAKLADVALNGPALMYRVEPVTNRQQILTNGFTPRDQANNAAGVYLFESPDVAKEYGNMVYGQGQHDIYSVNTMGLALYNDPNWQGHALYSATPIPANRAQLYVTAPNHDPQYAVYTHRLGCFECGSDHEADEPCPPTRQNHPQPEKGDLAEDPPDAILRPKSNPLGPPQFFV